MKRLNGIYERNLKNGGIDYIEGTASFVSDKVVQVGDKKYTAEHIMICSGSAPEPGKFPGSEHCWSSDDFFTMEELPKRMVVIGGGYIGIELAQILHALGVKVTLLCRSILLRFMDRDIIEMLMSEMSKLGMEVRTNSPHEGVYKQQDGSYTVKLASGEEISCDQCLVAMGRPPLLDGLKLENTGVLVENGAIKVDEF